MNNSAPQITNKSRNEKTNQNIQVYVRVRPLNTREKINRCNEIIDVVPPKDIVCRSSYDSKVTKKFSFDKSFGPESKQSDVYQVVVAPLIEEVLSGYNCTVFAYGQTGTGKTHTMVGIETPELKSSWEDDSSVGIIPRALCHLLDELRLMELEYTMRISYLELYNEELCDLLSNDDSVKIRIFDDSTKKGSVIIQGLEEVIVHGKDDVYKLLQRGQERRKTATTLMNAHSSRSHTVFSILVHIKENGIDGEEMLKIGKLNLVDLAGSENISKAGNEKGIRARETVNINQSLLTLGRVITALVERAPHIPYRESKLTRLLQESLGGRTKTSIIATISPGHKDIDETLSTLEYAHRAKNIQNKPEVNQKLTKKTVIKEYTEEIEKLKKDLMAARDKNGIYLTVDTYEEMHFKLENQNKELNEKMLTLKAMKEEMLKKESLFQEVATTLALKTEELERTEKNLHETKTNLMMTKKVLNTTKKRYKEKKVLLGKHIQTEEKLVDQASELIKVADVATTDHELFLKTLERRENVDNQIRNVTSSFKEKMENSLEKMNDVLDELNNKHKSVSNTIFEEISINNKKINKCIQETKGNITKLFTNCEQIFENFTSEFDKGKNEILESEENYKKMYYDLLLNQKKKDDNLKEYLNDFLKETKTILNTQKSIHETNVKLHLDLVEQNNGKDQEFCNYLKNDLTKFIDETNKAVEMENKKINEYLKKRNDSHKKKTELLSTLLTFASDLQEIENNENSENIDIQNISENMTTLQNTVSSELNQRINLIEEFATTKNEQSLKLNENVNLIQNNNNDKLEEINQKLASVEEHIPKCYTEKEQIEEKLKTKLKENEESIKLLLEHIGANMYEEKTKSTSLTQLQCKETESNIFEVQSDINSHLITANSLTNSLQEAITEYSNDFKERIVTNNLLLNEYCHSELKTYSHTGETPCKKEFSYPKVLVRTSPHSAIIKRCRLENDFCSDSDISNTTISEDYEESTILEIKDDANMRRSTPIKINNLECTSKSLDLNTPNSFKENRTDRQSHSLNLESSKLGIGNTSNPSKVLCVSFKENQQ